MGAERGFPSLRLGCLVLFVAFSVVVCSARQAVAAALPGNDGLPLAEGRALKGKVTTDDYSDPSANPGHDPKPKKLVRGRRSI